MKLDIIQYLEVADIPGKDDEEFEEWKKRDEIFWKIPNNAKENYANKYADNLFKKLKGKVSIILKDYNNVSVFETYIMLAINLKEPV